ncbi:hypothetical protein HUG17_4514 [Dermatophagoides farinae]|uniref:Uncharacterized protein n=1 Tax=Dermatophagoides farinae TaxID=6954 RepID=A0A9D4SHP4_DERFA|nr:hypothetical protein HUG17_4514 [Dermatophagoides farinae]
MDIKRAGKALSKEFEDPELINMYIQSMILKMTNVKDKYDTDGLGRLKRKLKNLRMPSFNLGPRYVDNTSQIVWKIANKFLINTFDDFVVVVVCLVSLEMNE